MDELGDYEKGDFEKLRRKVAEREAKVVPALAEYNAAAFQKLDGALSDNRIVLSRFRNFHHGTVMMLRQILDNAARSGREAIRVGGSWPGSTRRRSPRRPCPGLGPTEQIR